MICPRCGERERQPSSSYCRECRNEYAREYRKADREKWNQYQQEYRQANREKWREYAREYWRANEEKFREYKSDPEVQRKHRARVAVNGAVRAGKLEKPELCPKCGSGENQIEGHHHDYDQPLEVEWLCSSCHGKEHRLAS